MIKKCIFCILLLLFAFNTTNAQSLSDDILAVQKGIDIDPDNPNLHAQLAILYFENAQQVQSKELLKKAYSEILKSRKLQPLNSQYILIQYEMGTRISVINNNEKILKEVSNLYETAKTINPNTLSPSYYELILMNFNSKDTKNFIKVGQQALRENTDNLIIYEIMVKNYIQEKKLDLALDLANRGLKKFPNNDTLLSLIFYAYNKKLDFIEENNICEYSLNAQKIYQEQIEILNKQIKENPQDESLKRQLSSKMAYIGKTEQALYITKRLYEQNASEENIIKYAMRLSYNGKLEEAIALFQKEKTKYKSLEENLDFVYFFLQDWDNFIRIYKNTQNDDYFYGHLRYSIAVGLKNKSIKDMQNIMSNLPPKVKPNEWTKLLQSYMLGTTTQENLLNNAKHTCQKTEAFFIIACKFLIAGDKKEAYKYFQEVLNLKLYGYTEYASSMYFIKNLQ